MKKALMTLIFCLALALASRGVYAQTATNYDTLVRQGNTQLQAGDNDHALTAAKSAIKLNAERWEAYAVAGGALLNLKRYEEATDQFGHAIDHAPDAKQAGLRNLRKQCLLADAGASPRLVAVPSPAPAPSSTATQAEIVLWKTIENSATLADFQSYLDQYPNGAFAVLAKRHLAEAQARVQAEAQARIQEQARAREQAQWQSIQISRDPVTIQSFLSQYPNGAFTAQAQKRLSDLTDLAQHPTWTDSSTGLMWARQDNGSDVSWQQAVNYCQNLSLDGYTGWRLASIDELQGIYDQTQNVGEYHVKGNLQLSGWHWSNSTGKASGKAWFFYFGDGNRYSARLGYSTNGRELCVRRSGE
jgi:tetratricopeptide (TPR) repeat protein